MHGTFHLLANEALVVARALDEPAAFAAIYDHYFPRIYTYLRYRLRDPHQADDLTAQVFERALEHLASYRAERAPFGAWLFAIARNLASSQLRANRRRRWLALDFIDSWRSAEPAPDEIALRNERSARLADALGRLSERERDLLALKFAARLPNQQIADVAGLTESNVGVIVYRALRRLRALLQEEDA